MIVLDQTDRTVQMELDGAVAANQLPFLATYVDVQAPAMYQPAAAHGLSNGATAVPVVAAPAAGVVRQVKYLSVYNDDSDPRTVRLFYDDGGTERTLVRITLAEGSTVVYTDGEGFRVIDTNGNILVTANP